MADSNNTIPFKIDLVDPNASVTKEITKYVDLVKDIDYANIMMLCLQYSLRLVVSLLIFFVFFISFVCVDSFYPERKCRQFDTKRIKKGLQHKSRFQIASAACIQ